jgi:hypothetical protein
MWLADEDKGRKGGGVARRPSRSGNGFMADDGKRFDYLKLIFVRDYPTICVSTDSCIPNGMRFSAKNVSSTRFLH